jgi:hypothetical protein
VSRTERAIEHARALRAGEARAPSPRQPSRTIAIGDPQTNSTRLFAALDHHGLLGDDGWLAPDVRLISMGDHFDYYVPEREAGRVEGVLVLGWLAAHPREQVTLLAGNHDLARVMELVAIDDARFLAAGDLARSIFDGPRGERAARTAEFRALYPELATTGYAGRDYNAFTVEQRVLVQRLMRANRFDLALAEDGVLYTHAGVTNRELAILGVAPDAHAIAGALQARFASAIAAVAGDWQRGIATPLSLAPLHVAGANGREGGGLLYHRPADPERHGARDEWEFDAHAPRRFDPRTLPPITQVVGHTGHSKAWKEMPRWREPGMTGDRGGLRTLSVTRRGTSVGQPDSEAGDHVLYRRGIHHDADAIVWMIDPEMHYVASPADVAVFTRDRART